MNPISMTITRYCKEILPNFIDKHLRISDTSIPSAMSRLKSFRFLLMARYALQKIFVNEIMCFFYKQRFASLHNDAAFFYD